MMPTQKKAKKLAHMMIIFGIRHLVVMKISNKEEKSLDVKINDVNVRMEPDSGAEVNGMDEHQFKALKNRATEEIELQDSKIKLKTLQGNLSTKGEFRATISTSRGGETSNSSRW